MKKKMFVVITIKDSFEKIKSFLIKINSTFGKLIVK